MYVTHHRNSRYSIAKVNSFILGPLKLCFFFQIFQCCPSFAGHEELVVLQAAGGTACSPNQRRPYCKAFFSTPVQLNMSSFVWHKGLDILRKYHFLYFLFRLKARGPKKQTKLRSRRLRWISSGLVDTEASLLALPSDHGGHMANVNASEIENDALNLEISNQSGGFVDGKMFKPFGKHYPGSLSLLTTKIYPLDSDQHTLTTDFLQHTFTHWQ